jgi:CRP-like cAMP-binding protein
MGEQDRYIVGDRMPSTKISSKLFGHFRKAAIPMLKRKGTTLFRCGEAAKGAFLIRSGQVRLSLAEAPFVYPSRVLGPGKIIGLPASFSGEPYSLTAAATKDCRVDFIPRARLVNLFRRDPQVGYQILRILSEEISDMRQVKSELALLSQDWTAQ